MSAMILSRFSKHATVALFLSLSCLVLSGCGSHKGGTAVEGSVTLDGQPVDGGTITFVPDDPLTKPVVADIKAGKYALDSSHGPTPGKNRIQINWKKKTGRQKPSNDPPNMIDEEFEYIPDEYSAHSHHERDIKSGENNKFDFAIVSSNATRPGGRAPTPQKD